MKRFNFALLIASLIMATSTITSAATITSNGNGNWSASAWPNITRTGRITTSTSSALVTGSNGSLFTTEIGVGSIIKTTGNTVIGTVASVTDNTHLTLTSNANSTNTSINYHGQGVGSGDNVIIASGCNVVMDVADASCSTLTIDGNQTTNCSLTLEGTNTLTVAGAVTMNRPCAYNINSGTLNAASLNVTGGTAVNVARLNITTGTVSIAGNINFLGGITSIQKISLGAGKLNVGGAFAANGTLEADSGTVTFNGNSQQTIPPYAYHHLTVNNAHGAVLTDTTTVDGVLTLQSGMVDNGTYPIILGPDGSVVYSGGSVLAPLPVELTSFTAVLHGTSASLHWSTATETNNAGFQIERNTAGSDIWIKIVFVHGAGTSNTPNSYSYIDKNLAPGIYTYRIKQVDNDGTTTIYNPSDVPRVDAGKSNSFQLCGNYPNPFNPSTEIRFSVPHDGYASLKVYNIVGQEVAVLFSGTAKAGHYLTMVFNASKFSSGIYLARLQFNNQSLVQRMLLTK